MDRFSQMRVFVTVVERQSFTGAATALGMAKSTVSRQVSDLEKHLGARLLYRTTRVLHPTELGRTYFERCQVILSQVDDADTTVREGGSGVRGTLRIAAASLFATQHLIGPITLFQKAHPDVRVQLKLDDRYVNLVEDGLDLAIRIIAVPPDSSLVARRLTETTHHLMASPAFLNAHPIRAVDGLQGCPALTRECHVWSLHDVDDTEHRVEVDPMLSCNQGEPLLQACVAGMGVGLFPDFMTHHLVSTGRLVRVLPNLRGSTSGVYAIYPHRRLLSSRVRFFIDELAEAWVTPPWRA